MTNKRRIQEVIDRLPDDVSDDQAIDELHFWEKVQEGLRQANAGELIPHEEIDREFLGRSIESEKRGVR
jgi:predicted transcriptional regulator